MRAIDTTAANTSPTLPAVPSPTSEAFFQDTGSVGTVVPAWFMNMIMSEIRNAVVAAGETPSKTDWTQLTQAIRILGGPPYVHDVGAVNAMAVSLPGAPSAYAEGLWVRVKVGHTNTGDVTLNVDGLGAIPVLTIGNQLAPGTLLINQVVDLVYDGVVFQMLDAPYDPPVISIGINGYIQFPKKYGGVMLQWGVFNLPASGSHAGGYATFPTPFPNNCWVVVGGATVGVNGGSVINPTPNPLGICNFGTATRTNVQYGLDSNQGATLSGTWPVFFIALGN